LGILAEILEAKLRDVARLRSLDLPDAPASRPFDLARRAGDPLRLICEIKRRSPSAGPLSTRLSVSERAARYAEGGASMISVLCDAHYFDGAFEHLRAARDATSVPILCKEFVVDPVQIRAARAWGADAVLIIVRCVPRERVAELTLAARELGLEPFVEVTTEPEAEVAVEAGAHLIGVNARDLDTLTMDAQRAERVLRGLPAGIVRVHL
jgi:indole-3-glycerol phosphate synthase